MRLNVVPAIVVTGMLLSHSAHAEEALRLEQAVRAALDNNERSRRAPPPRGQAAGQRDRAPRA
ncbi:MAG: hypothetical protein KIS78_07475, partial [Labilithrix sp.]|nr:hypothetical protein [Labilithrix sp.]